jgi:hypothetical protein
MKAHSALEFELISLHLHFTDAFDDEYVLQCVRNLILMLKASLLVFLSQPPLVVDASLRLCNNINIFE